MTIKAATAAAAKEMGEAAFEAIARVADCRLDALAHCCSVESFIRGPGHDKELAERIKAEFGLSCITAAAATTRAFETLGIKRIVGFAPYTPDIQELEAKYFAANGVTTVHSKCMGIASLHGLAEPSPGEIYRLAKAAWDEQPDAEGFFIGSLNFRAHAAIQALENYIARPVVTGSQAALWAALRLAGIKDQIPGYGKLMLIP